MGILKKNYLHTRTYFFISRKMVSATFLKLTCFLVIVIMVVQEQVEAKGERCKRTNDCNSNESVRCCGFPKRCWECCRNADCPHGKKCKNRQCVDRLLGWKYRHFNQHHFSN